MKLSFAHFDNPEYRQKELKNSKDATMSKGTSVFSVLLKKKKLYKRILRSILIPW